MANQPSSEDLKKLASDISSEVLQKVVEKLPGGSANAIFKCPGDFTCTGTFKCSNFEVT